MSGPKSKWTLESVALWVVIGLGLLFVLAVETPLLLLGLAVGFVSGVVIVWRNPWGLFLFMRPDLEDLSKPMAPVPGVPSRAGQQVTINLTGDNVPIVKQPCAHCGSMVDIVQFSTCPKCGASLK